MGADGKVFGVLEEALEPHSSALRSSNVSYCIISDNCTSSCPLAAPAAADEPEAQRLSRAVRVLNCPCGGFVLRTECLPLLAHSEHAVVVAAGIGIIPP